LGRLAAERGLIWGGDWGRPDLPHSFVDSVHIQRCALWRQAALFRGEWYPDIAYDALADSMTPRVPQAAPQDNVNVRDLPTLVSSHDAAVSDPTSRRSSMSSQPTEAGHGESHVYRIPAKPDPDQAPLTADQDYLGIDAMTWYVNKESSWFRDRTASGILTITMNDGAEKYQTSLGTFELNNGQKTAPVFGTPVLRDRNYVGGRIAIAATLTAIRRDTVLGGLINSAASAGLGIIEGMVHTASVTGPTQILTAAGDKLISGIQKALDDPSVKSEPLFDANGIQLVLQASDIKGPEGYLLLHRGAKLDEDKLTLGNVGALSVPLLNGQPLVDGAWLLLKLRRSHQYAGFREWYTTARKLRQDVDFLVLRVTNGALAKDAALKEFEPSTGGAPTLWDRFAALNGVIADDGVISEVEAKGHVGKLAATLTAAKQAISAVKPGINAVDHFKSLMADLNRSLSTDAAVDQELVHTFEIETKRLADTRARTRAALQAARYTGMGQVRAIGGGGALSLY
jgi:hypothetical protein